MAVTFYYTSAELATLKQEIDVYLSANIDAEIKRFKNRGSVDKKKQSELRLLAIAREIINPYQAVDSTTDDVINQISEENLQTLVGKILKSFPTLKDPK